MKRCCSRRLILVVILVALSGAGCGQHAGPKNAVLTRLIGPGGAAAEILDPRTDFALEPVWQNRVENPAGLSGWSFYVPAAAARVAPGGGLDLGPLAASQYLVWAGRLEAGGIDLLRLRFREPLTGQVELYWNGEGEDFAPQRYALESPDPLDPRQVNFDLSGDRDWRGTVTRIGLRLLTQPVAGRALLAAEGLRYAAPQTLGSGETRYVELEGRGQPAWLARPASTIRRRVQVPRGARLKLQAAPWLPATGSLRIKVVAQGPKRSRVLIDRQLADRTEPQRRQWTRLEADLGDFAGETVELRFEAGEAPRGSLALWGSPQIVGPAGERRPNIVVISLDTVRADHLSLYGHRRPTSPHLDAWAGQRATVFENTVASAPWTLPSHVAMLSGIDAVHHGVNRHGPIPLSLPLLPQRLRDAGYATYATTAGVLLTPQLGFAPGFDEFWVRGKMESLPEWDAELGNGVSDAIHWLKAHREERFFLFFHTFEAHAPYQPRQPYFDNFGGDSKALNAGEPVWLEADGFEDAVRPKYLLFHPPAYASGVTYPKRVLGSGDRELATALYDSGLAYIDQQLSTLLEYLDSAGLLETTIVVVTSDHGESLYEHGLVGHSSLYDHDLKVPLVIAAPFGSAHGRRVKAQVRSVDIAPTLAELAGLSPLLGIDGSSLVPMMRGEGALDRDAWSYALSTTRGVSLRLAGRRKYIAQDTVFDPFRGGFEAYDLLKDPGEARNLAPGTAVADRQRQEMIRKVTAGGTGLEIRVANAGREELSGMLSGDPIDFMVTSPDLSFPCCESTDDGVRFHAPAGASFTLVLHDQPVGGILDLELRTAGVSWDGRLPLDTLPRRRRIAFEGGRWQPESRESGKGGGWTGVEIRRQNPAGRVRPNEEQTLKGLRSLGYIR